jgi:hypothetical protein
VLVTEELGACADQRHPPVLPRCGGRLAVDRDGRGPRDVPLDQRSAVTENPVTLWLSALCRGDQPSGGWRGRANVISALWDAYRDWRDLEAISKTD